MNQALLAGLLDDRFRDVEAAFFRRFPDLGIARFVKNWIALLLENLKFKNYDHTHLV